MRMPPTLAVMSVMLGVVVAGCGTSSPTGPTPPGAGAPPASSADSSTAGAPASSAAFGPERPPFNLEAVLRPTTGSGFGLVRFRQPNDDDLTVYLDVWVRDLAPHTSYSLQRAVDSVLDGECTGTAWLTLGKGLDPQPIVTDASGTGRESLFRALPSILLGTASDIHFRVVETATLAPVLQSACYRYVVSQ
jgi:hypothetical protein